MARPSQKVAQGASAAPLPPPAETPAPVPPPAESKSDTTITISGIVQSPLRLAVNGAWHELPLNAPVTVNDEILSALDGAGTPYTRF